MKRALLISLPLLALLIPVIINKVSKTPKKRTKAITLIKS